MAILSLDSATVKADGRVLELLFSVSPTPATWSIPDWRPGYDAGKRLTLSGGQDLELLGCYADDNNWLSVNTAVNTAATSGALPAGRYWWALEYARNADDVPTYRTAPQFFDIETLGDTASFATDAMASWTGSDIEADPPSHTLRVYLGTADDGIASMALYAEVLDTRETPSVTFGVNTWLDGAEAWPGTLGLTWRVKALVRDRADVIVRGTTGLTVTGPAGLYADGDGNTSAAFTASAVTNHSLVDADGFTSDALGDAAARGTNGKTLYVSATHGAETGDGATDLASGQSIDTPLLTLAGAWNTLTTGARLGGSCIKLLRGDTWTEVVNLGGFSGQDRDHPFVLESYWNPDYGTDPATRPILQHATSTLIQISGGGEANWLLVRGLHLPRSASVPSGTNNAAINVANGGTGLTFDDLSIEGTGQGIACQAAGQYTTPGYELTVLRCIIRDTYSIDSHSQGIFAFAYEPLISQCTLDTVGRKSVDLTGSDLFSHALYLSTGLHSTVWGSLVRQGGSHGAQMRNGGFFAFNLVDGCAIAGFTGPPGGYCRRNVFLAARDNDSGARGFGWEVNGQDTHKLMGGAIVEHNLFADFVGTANNALTVTWDTIAWRDAILRHNTARDAGIGLTVVHGDGPEAHRLAISHNALDCPARVVSRTGTDYGGSDADWLAADDNLYQSDTPATAFNRLGSLMALAAWQAATSADSRSTLAAPTFAAPSADAGDYHGSVGGTATSAAYVTAVRGRAWNTWGDVFDVPLAVAYIQAASLVEDAVDLAAGSAFDYFGASGPDEPGLTLVTLCLSHPDGSTLVLDQLI